MSSNPYAAPKTELSDPPKAPMAPWKAILLGLAIDIGGSILVGVILSFMYGIYLAGKGMSGAQIGAELSNLPPTSWLSILGTLAGALLSFVGGMVCTRAARWTNYSLGLVLAVLSSGTGLLFSFSQHSIAMNLVLTVLTFAAVMAGTKFGQVKSEA